MSKEIVEDKMTQLTELLGDIVERGCADELDSEPTTDFAKECWDRFSEIYSDPDFRHSYYTIGGGRNHRIRHSFYANLFHCENIRPLPCKGC